MKKFYSFLFAAVALVGFAACSEDATEDVVPSTEGGAVVAAEFTVSLDETRTQLDAAGKTVWCDDDTICVNGEEFSIKEGTLAADGYTATFSGEVAEADGYLAVYPYAEGMTVDAVNKTVSGVVVPATQALEAGSFAEGAAVAVGYTEDNTISFKNVVSVLKFQVAEACSTVTIKSGSPLAGTVTVNYNNGEPTYTVEAPSYTLTLTGNFKTGETYYAAVLAGEKAGLDVRLDGYLSKSAGKVVTTKRSTIMNMGTLPAKTANAWKIPGAHNAWSETNGTAMYTEGNFAVAYNVALTGEFKFNKGTWSTQVGAWDGTAFDFSNAEWYGGKTDSPSNIIVKNLASGTKYDIFLCTAQYDSKHDYLILPSSYGANPNLLSLIGEVEGSSWNADIDFCKTGTNTYEIRNIKLNGSFKVRREHGWHQNWGSGLNKVGVTADGENVKVSKAGRYNIKLTTATSNNHVYPTKIEVTAAE